MLRILQLLVHVYQEVLQIELALLNIHKSEKFFFQSEFRMNLKSIFFSS